MIPVVLICTVVFPVSAAGQAGEWEDTEYHEAYEDFSDCPKYTADDLVYNGELSTDVRINFNIKNSMVWIGLRIQGFICLVLFR